MIAINEQPRVFMVGTDYSYWNAAVPNYIFKFEFSSIPAGATSLKVDIQVLDSAGTVMTEQQAYSFNDIATVNVARSVQGLYNDLSTYALNNTFTDESLYAKFRIKYRESYYTALGVLVQSEYYFSDWYYVVRGAVQVTGHRNYYDATHNLVLYSIKGDYSVTGEFLTMFGYSANVNESYKIPVWNGYHRDLSFILHENSDALRFQRVGGIATSIAASTDLGRLRISTNVGNTHPYTQVYMLDATGAEYCSRIYYLELMEVGKNPFYIRWRNPLGGFDYWLFEKRQTFTSATSDTALAERDITDFDDTKGTHKIYRKKASESYLVGATNLTETQWKALNTLRRATMIEALIGSDWVEMLTEDDSGSYMTDKPAADFEIRLYKPEIFIAF